MSPLLVVMERRSRRASLLLLEIRCVGTTVCRRERLWAGGAARFLGVQVYALKSSSKKQLLLYLLRLTIGATVMWGDASDMGGEVVRGQSSSLIHNLQPENWLRVTLYLLG